MATNDSSLIAFRPCADCGGDGWQIKPLPKDGGVRCPTCLGTGRSPVDMRPDRVSIGGGELQLRAAEAAEELGWNEGTGREYEAFIAGWWTCWRREVNA